MVVIKFGSTRFIRNRIDIILNATIVVKHCRIVESESP